MPKLGNSDYLIQTAIFSGLIFTGGDYNLVVRASTRAVDDKNCPGVKVVVQLLRQAESEHDREVTLLK